MISNDSVIDIADWLRQNGHKHLADELEYVFKIKRAKPKTREAANPKATT